MTDLARTAFEPRTLQRAIEIRIPPYNWYAKTYFKEGEPSPSPLVSRDVIVRGRKLAPIQRPTEASRMLAREPFAEKQIRMPYMKPGMATTAHEIIANREIGVHVFAPADLVGRAQRQIGRDMQTLDDMIERRIEYMASQGIATGVTPLVALDQNGVPSIKASVDWNMPAAHLDTLTGAALWSADTSDPLGNVRTWSQMIIASSGLSPTTCTMGVTAGNAFAKNAAVRASLNALSINAGQMVLRANSVEGITFIGQIEGVDYYIDARTYQTEEGTSAYYTPADRVVLGSQNAQNEIAHGPIEDLECANPVVAKWVKTWTETEPSRRLIAVHAAVLPCVWQPDGHCSMKVV